METGLKRIEATLDQLNAQHHPSSQDAALTSRATADADRATPAAKPPSKSAIQPFPLPKQPEPEPQIQQTLPVTPPQVQQTSEVKQPQPSQAASRKLSRSPKPGKAKSKKTAPKSRTPVAQVPPFAPQPNHAEPPVPKAKPPSFSNHRHAVNPNLAIGMLKEVEAIVVQWQLELEQTVLEVQALYMEGPIVDGWLESYPYGSPQTMQAVGTATLRHAEIERLMEYVEEICRVPQTLDLGEVPQTGYRLCGLDADGQMWSRPCPAPQVPYVSLAVARYQKLRILLARKQSLESRLHQLVQSLTMLHGQMQEPL